MWPIDLNASRILFISQSGASENTWDHMGRMGYEGDMLPAGGGSMKKLHLLAIAMPVLTLIVLGGIWVPVAGEERVGTSSAAG